VTSPSQIDKNVKEDLHKIRQYQEQTSLKIEKEKVFEPEFFEVITDHQKASQILVKLAKSVKGEALILLPRDKSMVRLDRLQVFDYLIKASQENNNVEVKIICPLSHINAHIVKRISDCAPNTKILNGNNSPYGMFIIDNHKLFRADLREPNAEDLCDAIGFTIYSSSKVSASSFKSVFELLWAELVLNEELKRADNMQKEFINIAAHELRTPAQSILGYAELASTDPELCKHDKQGLIDAIYRNAIRLQRLTRNILDVTKIESNTLQLNKEVLNLNDVISNVVSDLKIQTTDIPKGKVIMMKYNHSCNRSTTIRDNNYGEDDNTNYSNNRDNAIFIDADKERITQVISNILNNAIKFTKAKLNKRAEGGAIETISIDIRKNDNQAVVNVVDTGIGIDPAIMSRIFEKFTTKSSSGTGLGLFISKSIVEAHGGRLWAQNNANGNGGATFAFSLPLSK
jgi:two-component system, OmpR family, sensor histidine kinase VicK